jgi:predicted FMN-binding regulatory protein PaiB
MSDWRRKGALAVFASPSYPQPTAAEIDAFVAAQWCGKVIAADAQGFPCVSILPFLRDGERIEVHMVQADPTFAALRARGRGAFLLDEPLAFTPHAVVSERDGGFATLHFRAVRFSVEAEVSVDPAQVAAALERLLRHYEGDLAWEPVADGPLYGQRLRRLAVAQLRIVGVEAKFKVAQNRSPTERERLLAFLGGRGLPGDALAAARMREAGAPR